MFAAVVALDAVWIFVNGPLEGPVLLRLTGENGITMADLLVPATLPVLGYVGWRLLQPAHVRGRTTGSPGEVPESTQRW